jgi:methyl-accepting chemotaxis protein
MENQVTEGTNTIITYRIQETEERISGIKDTIEEINTSVRQITNLIFPDTIYPENLEQYEKTEPKNNRNRRRIFSAQRPREYF